MHDFIHNIWYTYTYDDTLENVIKYFALLNTFINIVDELNQFKISM